MNIFQKLGFLFVKNIQNKISTCSYEITRKVKILPVTLFRNLVPAFREPPVTLKVVTKAACFQKSKPKLHIFFSLFNKAG
jgi:hypothetical protein